MRRTLLVALVLAGCTPDVADLIVDLRTDFVPGYEFDGLRVTLDTGEVLDVLAEPGRDYLEGVRVAELPMVETGRRDLLLSLLAGGQVIAEGRTIVQLRGALIVPVVITRDCRSVACAADQTCLRGGCVDARCSPLSPELCPAPECTGAADCAAPSPCAVPRCVEGSCLFGADDTGCGSDERCNPDFGCVARDDRAVVVTATAGTDVPLGAEVPIELALVGGWTAGQFLTLRALNGGEVSGDTQRGPEIMAEIVAPGGMGATFSVAAPFDLQGGAMFRLEADVPLSGDIEFTVVDSVLADQVVGGRTYQVADGFTLEDPLLIDPTDQATLAGRVNQIAFPRPGSAFAAGPYLTVTGDTVAGPPVEVIRIDAGRISTFATSNGIDGPDAGFTSVAFSDPATPWGDRLYVCSTSIGLGDGIFTVDPAGTFGVFWSFNNCNGMTLDHASVLDDPGFVSPMYVNEGSAAFYRVDPAAMQTTLAPMPLPTNGNGYKVYAPQIAPWAGTLYVVSERDGPGMGQVYRQTSVDPWGALELWLDALPSPPNGGVTFTGPGPMGARMYVSLRDDGSLRAYRADGTFDVVATGLTGVESVLAEADAVWVVERGVGQVLRLTHP